MNSTILLPGLQHALNLTETEGQSLYTLQSQIKGLIGRVTESATPDSSREDALLLYISELEAELAPLRESARQANQAETYRQRVNTIVGLLFPSYHWQTPEDQKPIRHPARAWWWNGASIVERTTTRNGELVEVSSYTGGGNTDTYEFEIPAQWLELEDATEAVHAWCTEETEKRAAAEHQKKIQDAQRAIERSAADLAKLINSPSQG